MMADPCKLAICRDRGCTLSRMRRRAVLANRCRRRASGRGRIPRFAARPSNRCAVLLRIIYSTCEVVGARWADAVCQFWCLAEELKTYDGFLYLTPLVLHADFLAP